MLLEFFDRLQVLAAPPLRSESHRLIVDGIILELAERAIEPRVSVSRLAHPSLQLGDFLFQVLDALFERLVVHVITFTI